MKSAIERIIASTRKLLEDHYSQAAMLPDDKGRIKIGFETVIAKNKFGDTVAKTKVSYGRRHTAKLEGYIEDDTQPKLDLVDGNGKRN
ncbi:MAG: hypothetical protein ABSC15_15485 [Terriglobales bacterium]|jgi:hypothetical protein